MRCPNSPLTATTTTSPGPTVLTNAASMPAEPVADSGRVRRFVVPNSCRSRSDVSSRICRNTGSRWPSSGWPRATVASGYGLDGPGPSRVRACNGMPGTLPTDRRRRRRPMEPLAPVRRDDARALWRDYAASRQQPVPPEEDPPVEQFGDHAALADELLDLVLAGTKRATAGLVADFANQGEPLPRIGGHWVVCDSTGAPRAVLRSTELRIGPLASVDDAFAWDEGENDRT